MARPAPDPPARAVAGEPPPRSPEPAAAPELTVGEAAGLLACVALAAVATASVALAEVGRHDGWLAAGLGVVATALVGTAAWRSSPRPRLRTDRAEAGLLAATAVAGAVLFLPGFPYASADKDPGVYVAHAFAIARQGDVSIPDAVLRHHLPTDLSGGARFPGIWLDADDPGVVTPQFFHLYPATLATAADLVGRRGVFNLTPLVAILSLCVWTLA
ncbi:MAG TPA: hypothetical protein VFW63_09945, partial [Acidimicrobiales bacterium]|nr:hypothetical protein [Acidimicrobiales bacterium]